jgi:hypothetical protein
MKNRLRCRAGILICFLCVALSPGCLSSETDGQVDLLGHLLFQVWGGVKSEEQQPDGTWKLTYEDEHRDAVYLTNVEYSGLKALAIVMSLEDPVIVQVPEDVTNIEGSYNDYGGSSGDLVVHAGLSAIQVTPSITMNPEAGHQLVIFEYPESGVEIPGPDEAPKWYELTVTADVADPRAIDVKAMFANKLADGEDVYYQPLFPGVTDFSKLPAFTIPLDNTAQEITFPGEDDLPETPETIVYDFSGCTDGDGDGFYAEADCGTAVDCDDTDAAVNPDADEVCDDDKDNDCDGTADCGDADCSDDDACRTCTDADGDSFYAEANCGAAVDCDDTNASVNPAASEVCDDGLDNDCDGSTDCEDSDCAADEACRSCTDGDGDGYYAQADCGTAVDCDDSNADIHPDAAEVCEDGLDNDCDGSTDNEDADCGGSTDDNDDDDDDDDDDFCFIHSLR